jgi:hypothetical protein
VATATVRWEGGSGEGVAGVAGSATSGVEAGLTLGGVRPYIRLGIGANVYLMGTSGDCIPESPSCGLAHRYAGNQFDPAAQASAGLELKLGGRALVLGLGVVWSEFEIEDGATSQRFLKLGMGLGL